MKKVIAFILLLALTNTLYAQTSCKNSLNSQPFTLKLKTNKINKSKNLIETNKCFSALQVKQLVDLFDYEGTRVDIAKYIYPYITNKSEYYTIVNEAMGFKSSEKKIKRLYKRTITIITTVRHE